VPLCVIGLVFFSVESAGYVVQVWVAGREVAVFGGPSALY
jgi:hypothetical protein